MAMKCVNNRTYSDTASGKSQYSALPCITIGEKVLCASILSANYLQAANRTAIMTPGRRGDIPSPWLGVVISYSVNRCLATVGMRPL